MCEMHDEILYNLHTALGDFIQRVTASKYIQDTTALGDFVKWVTRTNKSNIVIKRSNRLSNEKRSDRLILDQTIGSGHNRPPISCDGRGRPPQLIKSHGVGNGRTA